MRVVVFVLIALLHFSLSVKHERRGSTEFLSISYIIKDE